MDDSLQNQAQDSESSNQDPELLIPLPPAFNESSESKADVVESSQQVPTDRKRALAHNLHSDSDQESNQDDIENSEDDYHPKKGELLTCSEDSEEYTTVKGEFFCKKYRPTINATYLQFSYLQERTKNL